jgi:hypothetical protein
MGPQKRRISQTHKTGKMGEMMNIQLHLVDATMAKLVRASRDPAADVKKKKKKKKKRKTKKKKNTYEEAK